MHKKGYFITNHIDNLIVCDAPDVAFEAFEYLKTLVIKLGLVISQDKLYLPQTSIPCLGIGGNVGKTGEIVLMCEL